MKKILSSIIFSALLITIGFIYYNNSFSINPKFHIKLGQIAEQDIISPITFTIYPTPEEIAAQLDKEFKTLKQDYKISDTKNFLIQERFNKLFDIFNSSKSIPEIKRLLNKDSILLDQSTILLLSKDKSRLYLYERLFEELDKLAQIPIFEQMPSDTIKITKDNKTYFQTPEECITLVNAKKMMINSFENPVEKRAVQNIMTYALLSNVEFDQTKNKLEKEKLEDNLNKGLGTTQKNEIIVNKNDVITQDVLRKISSLEKATQNPFSLEKTENILVFVSFFLLLVLILITYFLALKLFDLYDPSKYKVIIFNLVISVIINLVLVRVLKLPNSVLPYSLTILIVLFLYDLPTALSYAFLNLCISSLLLNWDFINPFTHILPVLCGLIISRLLSHKVYYLSSLFYSTVAIWVFCLLISFINHEKYNILLFHLIYSTTSVVIAYIGAFLLINPVEKIFKLTTRELLYSFQDFNSPLLKKLAVMAPGTYHHSLIVGNIAEAAAEAINANPLITRVGSYYHDIGKILHPEIFIENNPHAGEEHQKKPYQQSALSIKEHVQEGINLARKFKLPKEIIDIIRQHHGTSKVRYFYQKAKDENQFIDEFKFNYAGPKPNSKEAVLVMVADIVESITKSLSEVNEEIIRKIIDDTILRLMQENQLSEAPISIMELDIAKHAMLPILVGVYRKRIEYPEDKHD